MPEIKAFYQPRSLTEALSLLAEHGDSARPLAGGTSLVFSSSARRQVLVDLRLAGLGRIEQQEDGLHLGPMVTCAALRRHLAGGVPTALWEAAGRTGSRILQNHITVGGNCVQVYAWSDLPVVLLGAGARLLVQGHGAEPRTVPATEFFAVHPLRLLAAGELVVQVVVPLQGAGEGSAYLKFCRTEVDHSMASVAAHLALEQGIICRASITAGAVRGLPQLLQGAAGALAGQAPGPSVLAEAARHAAQEAKISADFRTTAEFRRQLLATLVEDALALAVQRAGGEG